MFGKIFNKDGLILEITKSLGASNTMINHNQGNLTLEQIGKECKKLNNLYGYKFITLSFVFVNIDMSVKYSFINNENFRENFSSDNIFGITGSINDFRKFASKSNIDNMDFDSNVRYAMKYIHDNYSFLWD